MSVAGVGGQRGQMLLGPQEEGEGVAEWTPVLRRLSLTDLRELHLQLVPHVGHLGDAGAESQVGVGELFPHLIRQRLKEVLGLLLQPDGVGPHVLRVPDVVVTELGPGLRHGDPARGTGEFSTGEARGAAGLGDLRIQGR